MSTISNEIRQIIHLSFPPDVSGKGVVCNLVKLHDLCFNILRAQITPREEGFMALEIWGTEENFAKGLDYLKQQGIKTAPTAQKISRDEELCTHCGMCTAICPTRALVLDKATRRVELLVEKCSTCGMCTRVCPSHAMELLADHGVLG